MTLLPESEVQRRLTKYAGLVRSTAKHWRKTIGPDYDDEDIEQELWMRVLKALRRWDPDHPRAIPEERHVFGAVRNAITDLQRKGMRQRVEEVLTDRMPGDDLPDQWDQSPSGVAGMGLPANGNGVSHMPEQTEILSGLPTTHQRMAMMMVVGYSKVEIMNGLHLTETGYREHFTSIRRHILGMQVAFTPGEMRRMTAWEQLVIAASADVA